MTVWGWIIAALFLVFGVFAVALIIQGGRLAAAREELEAAEARITGYQEASRWWQLETKRVAEAAALDESLAREAGADAPLSDYLRNGSGRVWP